MMEAKTSDSEWESQNGWEGPGELRRRLLASLDGRTRDGGTCPVWEGERTREGSLSPDSGRGSQSTNSVKLRVQGFNYKSLSVEPVAGSADEVNHIEDCPIVCRRTHQH